VSHFYTSVIQRGNRLLVRGYLNGQQYKQSVSYRPYLFVRGPGEYKDIFGGSLQKLQFDSIYDAKDFVKTMHGVQGAKYWGMDQFVYPYINDEFPDGFEYDEKLIDVANIDVEVYAVNGFPDPTIAKERVTAITMIRDDVIYAWGCGEFPDAALNPRIVYTNCADEKELLASFMLQWSKKYPDVITGWNVEGFDIPYLVNRITRVLGEKAAKLLSPWGVLDEKFIPFRGEEIATFVPVGITVLDYLPIYRGKKFVMEPRESYTLNYIAHVELGEKKIDYSEYAGLWDLCDRDFNKFMTYNVHDAVLVQRLEEKLGLLSIIYQLAYGARTNFVDALGSVKQWEVIIYGKLMKDKIVVDGKQDLAGLGTAMLAGGYVKPPMTDGFMIWPVSLDLDSLYSHLIMQYNISPDTKLDKLDADLSVDDILDGKLQAPSDRVVAANLQTFRKDKRGFLPIILENMYKDRKAFKKKAIEAKKKHEAIEAELKRRGMTEEQLKDEGIINRV
jgi:DNA polymerase elongation subunit (family B)